MFVFVFVFVIVIGITVIITVIITVFSLPKARPPRLLEEAVGRVGPVLERRIFIIVIIINLL